MRRAIVSVFICSSFLRVQICAKPLQPRGERTIEDQIAALYADAGDERLVLDDLQPDAASDMALDQRMDLRVLFIAERTSCEHLGRDDVGSVCLMQLQHFSQLRAQSAPAHLLQDGHCLRMRFFCKSLFQQACLSRRGKQRVGKQSEVIEAMPAGSPALRTARE